MAFSQCSTPVHQNSNYADPHTRITSVKRPRSLLKRPMHPWRPVKREEVKEDVAEAKEAEETSSWVGSQVDALLSHWHWLWNIPEQQQQQQQRGTEQPRAVLHNNKKKLSLSGLQEKSASLGISTSAPTPNPPCFSCNTQFSFSGFHCGK